MIRFVIQRHECDHNTGLDRKDYITVDAEVPQLERLLREGERGEMGFNHCQVMGAEILDSAESLEPLPYWEPCNPGCDPEFNGYRRWYCANVCDAARKALAAHRKGVES